MHVDAHVESEVSESGQHIGDTFYVVPGLIVAKKVLLDQRKKAFHASSSTLFIEFSKSASLMSSWI